MCENGFDLNVRMASHGKYLAANRDVGLKLSQSDLILLVRCIEVYISVPKPGHLLTFGSDNCCEGLPCALWFVCQHPQPLPLEALATPHLQS